MSFNLDDTATLTEGVSSLVAEVPPPALEQEVHELAKLFPPMLAQEYAALLVDIREHGLRDPITVYEGQIVDGVHRHQACRELSITPTFVEWDGKGTLLDFVLSLNLCRRHLSKSQRAMVAARIANLTKGRPTKNARERAITQTEAAQQTQVSRTMVQQASKVVERGVPELTQAVERGEVTLAAAARLADLDPAEQAEVVAQGPAAVRDRAALARRSGRADCRDGPEGDSDADAEVEAESEAEESTHPEDGKLNPVDVLDVGGLQNDHAWLEGLPLWTSLTDRAAIVREALTWRRLAELANAACRSDPRFASSMRVRAWSSEHCCQVSAHALRIEHPRCWTLCIFCRGTGAKSGSTHCPHCRGDGFQIRRKDLI